MSPDPIAQLRNHPEFPRAIQIAARDIVRLYRADRLLNALMSDRARGLFSHAALYLHFDNPDADEPGFSVNAMKDLCFTVGICSRGRCEAMLALMRAAGLLAAAPNRDRRRRMLVPTDKLLGLHRVRWDAYFKAMSAVMPQAGAYSDAIQDPCFVGHFLRILGKRFIAGFRIVDLVPGLRVFSERTAGMMVFYSLALSGPEDGAFPPVDPVPLSINMLATRFSVSRKHVLTLLQDAEVESLLVRGGAAQNEVTLLPRARDALELTLAHQFLFIAEGAEAALQACSQGGLAVA
jgi:hypothetical protein